MAKKLPAWQIMGLSEAPPEINGYHHYGQVYSADQGSQRESLRHAWGVATWSWMYWGKKVIRDIDFVRAQGGRRTLAERMVDRLAIVLVRMTAALYRPKG